ncbi:MAG: ABC transporter substrate-binding protein, partial [Scytonema sp. PMC 1069.18]|nr:ABC transporter substrate-binding protein [Scytonema sp. PMC 1069.18]
MAVAGGRRRNPYIIGRPIEEPELFFGREALFGFIEDHLSQNVKVILLHGQRRIGKSSVLKQIHLHFSQRTQEFIFINYDLQDKAQQPLSQVLHSLAEEIVEHLEHLEFIYDRNEILDIGANLEENINTFSQVLLKKIFQKINNKKIVLLLDEFDVLSEDNIQSGVNQQAGISFFRYLKNLINEHEKLVIIPVIGRNLDDMPNLLRLFGRPPVQEIGLLDELSAQRLMTNPAQNQLRYTPDALKAILELSAGHPYFTQVICYVLFQQARENNVWNVSREDVAQIIDKSIECAEAGLDWYWRGLPTQEQVVFCAVAEAQRIAISLSQRVPEEPLMLLKSYGVLQTDSLVAAYEKLASNENRFLDNTGRRVKVELVRLWLLKQHPLRDAIRQLETIEKQEINKLLQQAQVLEKKHKTQEAIAVYEQILLLNPNHFSVVEALAQRYVATEKFDQAVELYTRVYQFDPVRLRDELLRTLHSYGEKLVSQGELMRAREQYLRILDIDEDNRLAQRELIEFGRIAVEARSEHPSVSQSFVAPRWRRRVVVGSMAVGICAVVLSVAGYRQVSMPCPAGQQKSSLIFCVRDQTKVSRGERTFFPNIKNPDRDQGLLAFEQGEYSKAAEFFKKALAVKPKDPEVLIYYNNARAKHKQQGSPLTLAVVVPADHADQADDISDKAKEVLRGVAQAQNQFNELGGFNGQLLEIAIANDSNNPDKAQQVAQELVKDKTVLGVIGHFSSNATLAALGIYEKASLGIISSTSTSTLLTKDSKVFFRTVPSDATTGQTLAEYVWKNQSINRVVVFYGSSDNSPYSNSLR